MSKITRESASPAAQSTHPWLTVAITCLGAFIGQLDASIVQLALPELERTFHGTLTAVSWVAIGYLLAYAATLPVFASVSDIFGRKPLYVSGYIVFTIATIFCGSATSLPLLIAFRLLQGVGGGMLGSNSLAILSRAVKPAQRGSAMGYFAAAQAVGISAGPVVGGLLLGSLGWRSVFWVSVPFSVAAAILAGIFLPQTVEDSRGRFDAWGGVCYSARRWPPSLLR